MPLSLDDVEKLKKHLVPAFREECRGVVKEELVPLAQQIRVNTEMSLKAERMAKLALSRKNINTAISAVGGILGGIAAYLGVKK